MGGGVWHEGNSRGGGKVDPPCASSQVGVQLWTGAGNSCCRKQSFAFAPREEV